MLSGCLGGRDVWRHFPGAGASQPPRGKAWGSEAGGCFSGGPRVPLGSQLDPVVHGSVTEALTLFSAS